MVRPADLARKRQERARRHAERAKGEFKHFAMDLEWLFRTKPEWHEIAQGVLFQPGDIVGHGEEAEEKAD